MAFLNKTSCGSLSKSNTLRGSFMVVKFCPKTNQTNDHEWGTWQLNQAHEATQGRRKLNLGTLVCARRPVSTISSAPLLLVAGALRAGSFSFLLL